jgi:CubicO group peptidase (beta-lactamase class C family)
MIAALNTSHAQRFLAFLLLVSVPLLACNKSEQDLTQAQIEQLRSHIVKFLEETGAPSVAVGVAKGGKIAWEEGFGWANKEKKVQSTPHTMYSVASLSKPMTATAVMILAERGLIDLNAPANKYLGEAKLRAFAGTPEDATVKRLLHHTAGLPMYWHFYKGEPSAKPTPLEAIQRFGILTGPPGDRYEYSNLGYSILATIVERVSGKTFPEFMRREIFDPLGMSRTSLFTEIPEADSVAPRYIGNREISVFYDYHLRGASAVYSSVHDLLRFGMFHLKNRLDDQGQIITSKSIGEMQAAVDPSLTSSRYKMGWDVGERFGYDVVTHGGVMPGARSMLLLLPTENIAVAVISNGENIELPRIYDPILASILPKYGERWKRQQSGPGPGRPGSFSPPAPLVGEWSGKIITYAMTIPVGLKCGDDGSVRLLLGGISAPAREITELASPPRFQNGLFIVNFKTELPIQEARQSSHTTYLKMKLDHDRLSGFALAVCESEYFGFPSYIELSKAQNQ